MKQPRQKKTAEGLKPVKLPPRRRGQGDAAPTTPKSYTVPFSAIVELRRAVVEHGSQGRALQVGAELAIRMDDPPEVAEPSPETMVRMTYKLLPRTIRLIAELAEARYGTTGKAIAACVKALKIKKFK
ncbi:MAG: hypothetical protein LAP21_03820 [Acidobacteriia bacterium]|nr:hypothetical protein [Terriglobia bacterium]